MRRFPSGFLWGVSTSAHQVEGGNAHNQWSAWEASGRVRDGTVSGQACDWWRHAEQDLDRAQQLGLNALRLSVEWSRLEPEEGRWDREVLARYYLLVREVKRRGMRPFLTLHHFTHPRWFEARGGFLAPDAVETFSRFVFRTVEALHEVCSDWVTVNEPNVYGAFGYLAGEFPPGIKGDLRATLRVLARLARCHASAYRIIHGFQPSANVGWAQNYVVFQPGSERYRDRVAARICEQLFNESFFQLLHTGRLPAPWDRFGEPAPEAPGKCDFTGLNVYNRLYISLDPQAKRTLFARMFVPEDVPQGDRGAQYPYGECYPAAIDRAVRYAGRFGRPIYILENGVPDRGDRLRRWLLVHAVRRLHHLIERGHDIRGYFHWTLVDSFEWSEGWRLRFGLYELDTATQQRRARPSAELYRQIVHTNGLRSSLLRQFGSWQDGYAEPAAQGE